MEHPGEAKRMRDLFQRRVLLPLRDLLRQGITPEKVALSVACGVVLGVFPVIGATTILCALAAIALRLNLPAIQVVNYVATPLQLALLLPLMRLGESIFRAPRLQFSMAQILEMIRADASHAISTLWVSTMYAIAAWLILAPASAAAIYFLLRAPLRRAAFAYAARPIPVPEEGQR
jgi:uncharacterized protein (DUF2062 family)